MCFATLKFAPVHGPGLPYGFSFTTPSPLLPVLSSPAHTISLCPHSSVIRQYRNFNLLSIGYVSPPLLRSRLTRGRSALPRNPWIFGQEDSHLFLATHSGILSAIQSTAPSGTASSRMPCSSTKPSTLRISEKKSSGERPLFPMDLFLLGYP